MKFITTKDIMVLCGCSKTKANEMKRRVHDETIKKGFIVANNRTCLDWVFEEVYGIKSDSSGKAVRR